MRFAGAAVGKRERYGYALRAADVGGKHLKISWPHCLLLLYTRFSQDWIIPAARKTAAEINNTARDAAAEGRGSRSEDQGSSPAIGPCAFRRLRSQHFKTPAPPLAFETFDPRTLYTIRIYFINIYYTLHVRRGRAGVIFVK